MKRLTHTIGLLTVAGLIATAPAGHARILADDEAEQAPTPALRDEVRLFSSIRMGLALSMAQCEGRELCTPTVNSDEVQRLLETLNTRIEDLTLKQESVEDPEAFEEVLSLYVDERDNLNSFLERLGTVEEDIEDIGVESEVVDFEDAELDETLSEDATFADEPVDSAAGDEFEIFEDVGEELEDDIGADEFDPAALDVPE